MAYKSNGSGRSEVYVRPFPNAAEGKWTVSSNGGFSPAWAHSGDELFYIDGSGLVVAQVTTDSAFAVRNRRTLFPMGTRFLDNAFVYRAYDIAPDDSRFIMIETKIVQGTASGLVLIENPFEEFKAQGGN